MDATRELAAFDYASSVKLVGQDLGKMLQTYPEARGKADALADMNREIRRAREALDRFEALIARESRDLSGRKTDAWVRSASDQEIEMEVGR